MAQHSPQQLGLGTSTLPRSKSVGMKVRRLTPVDSSDYFDQIAELHTAQIHHGILPLLGHEFLLILYRGLSGADRSGVWVALTEGKVIGFIAGCANTRAVIGSVLATYGVQLLIAAGKNALSLKVLRKLFTIAMYPFRRKCPTNPAFSTPVVADAELLAISVAANAQGSGIGRLLVLTMEDQLVNWGMIEKYHVKTNVIEVASNAFYTALGFQLIGTVTHHALQLNIYQKPINASHYQTVTVDIS